MTQHPLQLILSMSLLVGKDGNTNSADSCCMIETHCMLSEGERRTHSGICSLREKRSFKHVLKDIRCLM